MRREAGEVRRAMYLGFLGSSSDFSSVESYMCGQLRTSLSRTQLSSCGLYRSAHPSPDRCCCCCRSLPNGELRP
ncbi:hypothetical protein SLEP1_g34153 [Rubroshorea leprosula]|uniref:Uncharacterized protein n=1 Tax=Rubroshorea leprosula TaxID=152421 RepID=A0AAV5KIW8_9ROSI|nr:hypothetical protein SLEP1_g34151 [Rubroshorea leprosula]GKV24555.1 hypothetical protein SLEP1_g34153 [Rubroshorea leprosula]